MGKERAVSNCLSIVYKKTVDFYMLIVPSIYYGNFLIDPLGFSMYMVMSPASKDFLMLFRISFLSFLPHFHS